MSDLFRSKTMTLLEKTLNFRTSRHDLLVSNIANKDTPGFQAQDLVFEKSLKQALKAGQPGPLQTKEARHFDGNNTKPLDQVTGQRITSAAPFVGFDGNTVDLDKEMSKLAENQLMYNATIRMVSHQFRQLRNAIKGGV
ncbi:flagellar basal body rod protein FlgB [Deltaproteobacteria bacterium TL4]